MAENTVTRADLAEAVRREIGLSRNEVAALVESALDKITEALVRGEPVKIASFGTFSMREKSARMGRNPRTGEEAPIEPRRVLAFRPSSIMRARINPDLGDDPEDEDDLLDLAPAPTVSAGGRG